MPPVLQIHVPQVRAGSQNDFDRAAVQPGVRLPKAGRFAQQRRLGSFFQDDQGVADVGSAVAEHRQHVQRLVHDDAARHVQHLAARPAGGVQCRELVVLRIDDLSRQVRTQPIAVLADRLPTSCRRARRGPSTAYAATALTSATVDGHHLTAKLDAFAQQARRVRSFGRVSHGQRKLVER